MKALPVFLVMILAGLAVGCSLESSAVLRDEIAGIESDIARLTSTIGLAPHLRREIESLRKKVDAARERREDLKRRHPGLKEFFEKRGFTLP